MKSIYKSDDLRCNEVGLDLIYEAEKFFKAMMDKYPEYNTREMVELFLGIFDGLSNRRIIEWRKINRPKQPWEILLQEELDKRKEKDNE